MSEMNFKAVRRCERAREYASLALDDELSQFEHALLRAHLEQCDGCRSYQVGLVATTDRLRSASLERLSHPIALPRRQRVPFRGVQVGLVAALVVVAVGLGTVLSSIGPATRCRRIVTAEGRRERELQDIRREWPKKLRSGRPPGRARDNLGLRKRLAGTSRCDRITCLFLRLKPDHVARVAAGLRESETPVTGGERVERVIRCRAPRVKRRRPPEIPLQESHA